MNTASTTDRRRSSASVVDRTAAPRRAIWAASGVVVGMLIAGAVGAYLFSSAQYRASSDAAAPVAAKLAAAEAAARFWPIWGPYRIRVITLRGLRMFEAGDILGAYDLLHAEYVREAIAKSFDPQLAAVHEVVWQSYWDWSSRAAHVMHGKEQSDGTIKPEDVQHFPQPATK
jgi:hypothetical protein